MIARNKTIIFVLPNFGGGGAESVMITLANELTSSCNVHFVVGLKEGEFEDRLSSDINIHNLNAKRFSTALFPISSIIKKIKPDVILSTLIYCNIITSLAAKLSGTKARIILREATTPSKVLNSKNWLFNFLYKFAYNRAYKIIAVSEGVKADIITNTNIKNSEIEVITNPIVGKEIFKLADSNEKLDCFSKDSIVTVGKVTKAKDYLTLAKAFNIVKKQFDCQLIIVGKYFEDSFLYKELQNYIIENQLEEDILFLGFKKNPFVYMKRAKVFVLSSIYEGSPGVLVQGLAVNGNVVSTDCESGPREILANGEYGRLVPIKDYKALAEAIVDALKNPKDEKNSPTLADFSIEKSVQNYSNVLFDSKLVEV